MTLTSSNSVHCSFGSSILALYKMVALAMRKFLASRSCRDTLLRASVRIGVSLLMSSLHRPDSYNHKSLFIIQFLDVISFFFHFFRPYHSIFHFLQKKKCAKHCMCYSQVKNNYLMTGFFIWLDLQWKGVFTCRLYTGMCIY